MGFQELNQVLGVLRSKAKIGHLHLPVLIEELDGQRIFFRKHLVRLLDKSRKPRQIADIGDTRQIRANPHPVADRVARGAACGKKVLALGRGIESRRRRVIQYDDGTVSTADKVSS